MHAPWLSRFTPVSLAEMDAVALTNRIDTKYVIPQWQLPSILQALTGSYHVLDIDGKREHPYETLYFDTTDFRLYLDHHNGRGNRYKLRLRKYGNSAVSFMELKRKTNTGRTVKSRKKTTHFGPQLSPDQLTFFRQTTGEPGASWQFSSRNCFQRITLVSMTPPERLTLDVQLTFNDQAQTFSFPELVIAEVKQGSKAASAFITLMKSLHIPPFSISKYCLGVAHLHPELKRNLFKRQHLTLKKLQSSTSYGT